MATNPPDPTWTEAKDHSGSVSLGTHSVYLHASGPANATPSVIIEGGLGASSSQYIGVHNYVAEFTRVYSYDRAGYGRSTDPPAAMRLTAKNRATELKAVIDAAGIPGPYVLLGHSYGGALVRQFVHDYGKDYEIHGMVFVDAPALLLELAQGILGSFAKLGNDYTIADGSESNHVLTKDEWATWKKDGRRGMMTTMKEFKEVGPSMKSLWKLQEGKQILGDKRVCVIHGDIGADVGNVYNYAKEKKKLTEPEREAMRKALEEENLGEKNKKLQEDLLSLSSQSKWVQAEGSGRTHNVQFVQPDMIAEQVKWVCGLDE